MSTQTKVTLLPNCDMCDMEGKEIKALYDAKLNIGPWANVCQEHFRQYGCSLGLGKGQKLIERN